jgi:hypothetical protein
MVLLLDDTHQMSVERSPPYDVSGTGCTAPSSSLDSSGIIQVRTQQHYAAL